MDSLTLLEDEFSKKVRYQKHKVSSCSKTLNSNNYELNISVRELYDSSDRTPKFNAICRVLPNNQVLYFDSSELNQITESTKAEVLKIVREDFFQNNDEIRSCFIDDFYDVLVDLYINDYPNSEFKMSRQSFVFRYINGEWT